MLSDANKSTIPVTEAWRRTSTATLTARKAKVETCVPATSIHELTNAVFKQSFHLGDAEPDALSRYVEHKFMVDAMDEFIMSRSINPEPFELCKMMQMADMFREERRIVDDAFAAYASIAVFFEGDAFLASEYGEPWRDTKLLDQKERAKHVPDRRTHMSNKTMPKEFWKDWEELLKENKRHSGDVVDDIYPMEWRKALRPIIIKRKHISFLSSIFHERSCTQCVLAPRESLTVPLTGNAVPAFAFPAAQINVL